jgi:hypothetical protein
MNIREATYTIRATRCVPGGFTYEKRSAGTLHAVPRIVALRLQAER